VFLARLREGGERKKEEMKEIREKRKELVASKSTRISCVYKICSVYNTVVAPKFLLHIINNLHLRKSAGHVYNISLS